MLESHWSSRASAWRWSLLVSIAVIQSSLCLRPSTFFDRASQRTLCDRRRQEIRQLGLVQQLVGAGFGGEPVRDGGCVVREQQDPRRFAAGANPAGGLEPV